jgi:hypothetical protein
MNIAKPNWGSSFRCVLVMAALLVTTAVTGRADGIVLPPVLVPQQVTMPDQRALLAWKDGVETLVIESAFVGKGTDFAWVVPLPSKPEVFPATRGTLPAAVALMQPTLAEPWPEELWIAAAALLGIGFVTLVIGWRWLNKTTMLRFLGYVLLGLMLVVIFIPSVGKVGQSLPAGVLPGGITVERHQVGDYDVAVLSGTAGDGVVPWLEANGFALGAAAKKVTTEHTTAGGWFVASRVRRDFAQSGRSVPAPLAFRFAAKDAFYPMRLTGAGAEQSLTVELVVFGPSRAEVAGLATRSTAPLSHKEPQAQKGGPWGGLQAIDSRTLSHPELTRWTQGTVVATWLRGKLSPKEMQADLPVRWTGSRVASGINAHTQDDAWLKAALLTGLICFVSSLAVGVTYGNSVPTKKWVRLVALVALTSGATLRALTPTVAVTKHRPSVALKSDGRQVVEAAGYAIKDLPGTASDEMVQAAFSKVLGEFMKDYTIGDAPGEVTLHKLPNGNWRVWFFNAYGQPQFLEDNDVVPNRP